MIREGFARHEGLDGNSKTASEYYKRFQENASFYHLSGDPELTQKDFERYEKSQERVQKETPAFIVEGLKHGDLSARLGMIEVLAQAPEDQQEELREFVTPTILEALRTAYELYGLENEEEIIYRENYFKALRFIQKTSEQQRFDLYEKIFSDKYTDLGYNNSLLTKIIDTLPECEQEKIKKELVKRVKRDLQNEDPFVRNFAVKQIEMVLETDKLDLIEQALQNENVNVRCAVINVFNSLVSQKDRLQLFERGLKDKEETVRKNAASQFCEYILKAPAIDRPKLLEQEHQMQNPDLSKALRGKYFLSVLLYKTNLENNKDGH